MDKLKRGQGGKGNQGVAGAVQNTPNSVGYVELSYAIANNIPMAQMVNKAGKTVTAAVARDVKDRAGRVVIPAGSVVTLTVTELAPAKSKSAADGKLVLQATSVNVKGRIYALDADVDPVAHEPKGRGVTAGEAEKVGVGTAIGVIGGRIIGGNTKGAVIGGVVGAGAGTAVAVQTASRDVVVRPGTPVKITLRGTLVASR